MIVSPSRDGETLRIVMMGPPGAGKGTQGVRLARAMRAPHIASGDILRSIIATEDSELARAARVINEGKLLSDEVVNAIVFRELERPAAAHGFVLDGYPRNVTQAQALESFLMARGQALDGVVSLQIDEEVVAARLIGRLTCPQCGETYHVRHEPPKTPGKCDLCGGALEVRADDHPDRIRTRFALYYQKTEPLTAYYRERGLLRTVDASGSEDSVYKEVVRALGIQERALPAGAHR